MEEMLNRLKARRAELVAQSEQSNDINELRGIQKRLLEVNEDISYFRQIVSGDERTQAVNGIESRAELPKFTQGEGFKPVEIRAADYSKVFETREKAGADLKEKRAVASPLSVFGELRAVTVNGGSIVLPKVYSPEINPDFNRVSSLIDSVAHLSLTGGESFTQPYVSNIAVGGYTAETSDATVAETSFGYAEITKAKITAYAELTEELVKLPNAAYADVVFQNIRNSMRMLLTKEILVGAGNNNQMVGIFSSGATAIDSDTDLSLSTIDSTTLDEIVYSYGGEEDIETPAVLILNKADLLEFAKVRTSTTLRYYDIQSNGNTGTINGVPFIINSACKQLTSSTTTAGQYCMAFGNLTSYQLVEFSPMEIKASDDYKFKQGMSAYRGVAFFGGNVVRKNGFLRVKKSSS